MYKRQEYAEVIAPFFKDVTAEQIYKALKGMVFYHKLFLAPTSGKRKALFLGMKAVGKYDSLHDIVMSVKPEDVYKKQLLPGLESDLLLRKDWDLLSENL